MSSRLPKPQRRQISPPLSLVFLDACISPTLLSPLLRDPSRQSSGGNKAGPAEEDTPQPPQLLILCLTQKTSHYPSARVMTTKPHASVSHPVQQATIRLLKLKITAEGGTKKQGRQDIHMSLQRRTMRQTTAATAAGDRSTGMGGPGRDER
ncbi:hypothetical protein VTJ04DRAFT_9280 [Mycothermus thermophilus]|uniref:uncharacterized protein n=1 Tax=Humicola insolens TaxID=85995 RepID=UPI0037445D72